MKIGRITVTAISSYQKKWFVSFCRHSKKLFDFDLTLNTPLCYLNIDFNNRYLPF